MPLSAPQQIIFDDPHRFRTVVAGRRFGKSHLLMQELAYHARIPDQRAWAVYPSYRQGKQILWKPLKKRLVDLNWVKSINETDLTIVLRNDSEISIRSADNYDSMRGVGLNFVALDEAADMELNEVWNEVLRPTLSDTGGRALFVGTPKGLNYLKDLYDLGATEPEAWASYQFTTLAGGRVLESEIEAARRDLDERTFRQEYMASFETYAGLIYYAFDSKNIVPVETAGERETIMIGLDFNIDPLSAVVAVRRGDYLHILDEIVITGANTFDFCEEVRRRYPGRRIEVYPDASGAQRRTSSTTTDHAILANAGFTVRVGRTNPAVLDRIAAVNSRLCSSTGTRFVVVNNKCRNLIKSLTSQTYKEGTRVPDKNGFDHMNDAIGYLIAWHWPIRREIDTTGQPQYWSKY